MSGNWARKAREEGDMDLAQRLYLEELSLHFKCQKTIIAFIEGHRESWIGLFVLAAYHRDLGKKTDPRFTHKALNDFMQVGVPILSKTIVVGGFSGD